MNYGLSLNVGKAGKLERKDTAGGDGNGLVPAPRCKRSASILSSTCCASLKTADVGEMRSTPAFFPRPAVKRDVPMAKSSPAGVPQALELQLSPPMDAPPMLLPPRPSDAAIVVKGLRVPDEANRPSLRNMSVLGLRSRCRSWFPSPTLESCAT